MSNPCTGVLTPPTNVLDTDDLLGISEYNWQNSLRLSLLEWIYNLILAIFTSRSAFNPSLPNSTYPHIQNLLLIIH